MFLTEAKLQARIRELAEYRYRDARAIARWSFVVDEKGEIGARPGSMPGARQVAIGDGWKGRDVYAWLGADVTLPAEWAGRRMVGVFDFGRTGGGNNSGFESLLYVDGEPFQGVDGNHREVFFPASFAGRAMALRFRLWSGLEGGGRPREQEHRFTQADIAWLDETADDLYHTARAMLETINVLDEHRPERVALVNALDGALRLIDWSRPGAEGFYESLGEARQSLEGFLSNYGKQSGEQRDPVTVHCLGHTHIDVAWLWRLKHTREKAARSFSTVLRLMELFPEYTFLQTQPQLYEYLKGDYPEIYEGVKRRADEGRWEAGGAMWLEADCNLTSGESLVRQILYGMRFFEREFGRQCTYLWLPDVFGYSWALPQILKKSGIHTFVTTKISWNQYNRMPHDTFVWRGIDGSEVLAHFITTPEPAGGSQWYYTYNGQVTAETVTGAWDAYRDKRVNRDLLVSYGYGDGGGGVNREMLEMRRRLDRMPGLPKVVTGRADEYFARLQETVASSHEYVHTWDGELYLEYHRGTYTSQAYNKRMNRKLELGYRETEWLGVLAGACAGFPTGEAQMQLFAGWKIILRNQFHDIIPGSSIREVYEDSREEYAEAAAIMEGVRSRATAVLVGMRPLRFAVLNSAGWLRTGLLRIPVQAGMESGFFADEAGSILESQRLDGEWLVRLTEAPAMGVASVSFNPGAQHQAPDHRAASGPASVPPNSGAAQSGPSPFSVSPHGIITPLYELEWNEHGQMTRIYDRRFQREVLADGGRGNVLQVFEDKPLAFDAWNIDIFYQEKCREVTALEHVETVSAGALCAVVRFRWTYGESVITQDLMVYAHSPRLDFVTQVDWRERQQLLKVAFPVAVRSTEATYDIQFGNTRRPTHWNTSWDQARFETVAHQWADLSETGYGAALANDCKYGYDIKNNTLRLSLIKSAVHPDHSADQGQHEFTYALIPHTGDWLTAGVAREAWDLNSPLCGVEGQPVCGNVSLFAPSSDHVMIDAVKWAEGGDRVVLRLHDFAGGRGVVRVASDLRVASWQECDLLERPVGEASAEPFVFAISPYEIKTFLVAFGPVAR
ncbi:MAG: alpha-mannosidase [Bacilli bacterium]